MWKKLFGKGLPPAAPEEPLVIVPIPALVTLLVALRKQKGVELTEQEVLALRDGAACIAMRAEHARALAEKRGYPDIDPENAWEAWQAFVKWYDAEETPR